MVKDYPHSGISCAASYDGIVVRRVDPLRLGRLKVRVVGIHSDAISVDDLPWSGPDDLASLSCGLWWIPPIGSFVRVTFKNGDWEYPTWSGGWWGQKSGLGQQETAQGGGLSSHTKFPMSWFGSQSQYDKGELLALEDGVDPVDAPNNFVLCSPNQKRVELDDRKNRQRLVVGDFHGNVLYLNTEGAVWTLEASNGVRTSADKPRGIVLNSNVADGVEQVQIYTSEGWQQTFDDVKKVWEMASPSGHVIREDDDTGRIEIWTKDGNRAIFDDDAGRIDVSTRGGRRLLLDDGAMITALTGASDEYHFLLDESNELVEIFSGGDINIKAPNGKINISAMERINVDTHDEIHLNSGYLDVSNTLTRPAAYQKPDRLPPTPKSWDSPYYDDAEIA